MKLFKRTLIVLLLILCVSAGALFVALTFYKKELTQALIDELKLKYGLTLLVEEVNVSFKNNWPHVSVQLINVSVASERKQKTIEPFLRAGALAVSFNMVKLLQKKFIINYVSLDDVNLNLIKYADGTKNFETIHSTDTTKVSSGLDLNLDRMTFKNVKFQFVNEKRGQKIGLNFNDFVVRLKNYEEGMVFKMNGEVMIKGLLFNPNAGEFLTNTKVNLEFDGAYFEKDKQFCVYPPSVVVIDKHLYSVCSIIDLSDLKRLFLVIESKGVKSAQVANYLTPKIKKVLSNFKMKHTLDAKFLMVAKLGVKEEPVIIADITGKDCDLKIGNSKIPFSNLSFKGRVLSLHQNRKRGDMDHAKVVFESIKGKIYDFPFSAKLKVLELSLPLIDLQTSLVVDGKNIKKETIKDVTITGTGLASIHYSGKASNLTKDNFLSDSMNLSAYLVFTNLGYKKNGSNMAYVFNGKATVKHQNLSYTNLRVKTELGDLVINGTADNFLRYLFGMTNLLKAKIDARCEQINLNPLFITSEAEETTKPGSKKSDLLDRTIFDVDLNLTASKLIFRRIAAKSAAINLKYNRDLITLTRLHLHVCQGEIIVNGKVNDLKKINSRVSIKNVDATQLFEQFENFGQDAVKSENIKGKIFLEGTFSAELNKKKQFIGESLKADVTVKVLDGHLIDYEPLQNIASFLFKQRDFKDVSFSGMKETLKVRGFEIKIDELEIASNVLNLYIVDGLYAMKGNSNINMLIPWSNLKKRDKNYIPKGSGESAENTKGLKLNYSGPPKKMKLSFGHKEQEQRFW